MVKLDQFTLETTSNLQELVDTKIVEQTNKIQAVTETFKDALLLSNKTYFLEEMSKHKLIAKEAKKESKIYKQKLEILEN
jgi:hypothetical protein|tara:strand:+ start:1180 stop:1419 length:240 start_codon:yes stop_codon:yes gene_type:complete